MKNKLVVGLVATALVMTSLAGCGSKDSTDDKIVLEEQTGVGESDESDDENSVDVELSYDNTITISEIKEKYGVTDEVGIKPFYNVEQTTEFLFHFNSDVEPALAVTVHTDPSCNESSIVYQINNAYEKEGVQGRDILVKPGSPVLNSSDRTGGKLDNYNWGYAPVYYLSINYDMESTEVKELETPIIVPFTIRSDVSIPNLTCSISDGGEFALEWHKVDGAVKYNIYEAYEVRAESAARKLTRSEAGYVGDHLQLLTTVSGDTTSFKDFHLDGTDNELVYDGYTSVENFYDLGTYYITAVDEQGNESLFSMAVEGWKYNSQLPNSLVNTFSSGVNTYLPSTVEVLMKDHSKEYFPIDYKYVESNENYATYVYEVRGTKLNGKVQYQNSTGEYEDIISTASVNTLVYEVENDINIIPANTVNTITGTDSQYRLDTHVEREGYTKLSYDTDVLTKRADLENARMVNDGVYPEGTSFKDMLNAGSLQKGDTSSSNIETEAERNSTESFVDEASNENSQAATENEGSSLLKNDDSVATSELVENEEVEDSSDANGADSAAEVTSENLVEKQIETTQTQVEEANASEVPSTKYRVFADSAEEEYVALNLIGVNEQFSVEAFPSLQNAENLLDVLYKVIYQNPYVFSVEKLGYDTNSMTVVIGYGEDTSVIQDKQEQVYDAATELGTSIKAEDTEGIIRELWEYYEENTVYDDELLAQAEANGYETSGLPKDSFNSYGILVNKVGVCQSYALATKLILDIKDVDCEVVTGLLNGTVPHAWNVVSIDGDWYWLDATNNQTNAGIPFMVYQTSSDTARDMLYVTDDLYALNSELSFVNNGDTSKDYYVENGLVANNRQELIKLITEQYKDNEYACVRALYSETFDEVFLEDVLYSMISEGLITEDDLDTLMLGSVYSYVIVYNE